MITSFNQVIRLSDNSPNPDFKSLSGRLFAAYHEAADYVLLHASTPWEIDEAMELFGFHIGPYEAQDLIGLDVAYENRIHQDDFTADIPSNKIIGRMIELGKLGKKTGAGWYRYPGGGGKVEDPIVADLALEEAWFGKVNRIELTNEAISKWINLAIVNEAANCLHKGISSISVSQINEFSIGKLNFSKASNGLLGHADDLGIPTLLNELEILSKDNPKLWMPSPLFNRMIEERLCFSDLDLA